MKKDIFEQLYQAHYKDAFLYVFSLCHHKELTEDIVSSAFEKALTSFDDSHPNFHYWLLRVCKTTWLNEVKKLNKQTQHDFDFDQLKDMKTPQAIVVKKENQQQLYSLILTLPSHYQELLVLYYYLELSLAEIATLLNLSPSNTKTLLHRARLKLKQKIKEAPYEF